MRLSPYPAYSYIVEFRPEPEWDARLGWLQTFYGTGQAAGLLIAAAIQSQAMLGLWGCALLMIPGFLLARIGLPKISRQPSARAASAATHNVPAMTHARTPASILRHYEHLNWRKLQALRAQWWSFFGLFMLSWFLLMLGTWMVYNLYPLLMKNAFDIPAGLSSLYYGIAATIGIFFYAPSGSWAVQYGSSKVVLMGIFATLGSISGMAVLLLFGQNIQAWLDPPVFILLPVAWSPMIVAGTALTGRLIMRSGLFFFWESQRDSVPQPRVAAAPLPWEMRYISVYPKGVESIKVENDHQLQETQPPWGCFSFFQ